MNMWNVDWISNYIFRVVQKCITYVYMYTTVMFMISCKMTTMNVPSKHVLKGPGIYFSGKPGWESSGFVHGFAPGPFSEYR